MQMIVNGTPVETEHTNLEQLIEHYDLNKEHVVAEVDGVIVERDRWKEYELSPGAKVELVHFVGGG